MPRVLVVARNPDVLDALQLGLTDLGHVPILAGSADRAVAAVQSESIDVAIVEAVPPDFGVFGAVRDALRQKGVPCVALATGPAPAGAKVVLAMPLDAAEIEAALKSALAP